MTLIALSASTDHATVMVDSQSMAYVGTSVARDAKVMPLPQIDAVVVTQGSSTFGYTAQLDLLDLASQCSTFDEFARPARDQIKAAWAQMGVLADRARQRGSNWQPLDSAVFLVGYSHEAGSFTATCLASDFGFTPVRVDGLHVQPAPSHLALSALEHDRLTRHFDLNDLPAIGARSTVPNPVPATEQEWRDLAVAAWRDRSFAPIESGWKWITGGAIFLSTLTRGCYSSELLCELTPTREEFAEIVRGTLHPIGQAAPCVCGTGLRLIDCCADHLNDGACPCESGRAFRDCCSIDAGTPSTAPREAVTAH